jgi:hypothetical protein
MYNYDETDFIKTRINFQQSFGARLLILVSDF